MGYVRRAGFEKEEILLEYFRQWCIIAPSVIPLYEKERAHQASREKLSFIKVVSWTPSQE